MFAQRFETERPYAVDLGLDGSAVGTPPVHVYAARSFLFSIFGFGLAVFALMIR